MKLSKIFTYNRKALFFPRLIVTVIIAVMITGCGLDMEGSVDTPSMSTEFTESTNTTTIENASEDTNVENTESVTSNDIFCTIEEADYTNYTEIDSLDYYYSKLNDYQRKVYDAMHELIRHTNEDGFKVYLIIPSDKKAIFYDDFEFIFYCLMYDYPEYYQHQNNEEWTIKREEVSSTEDEVTLKLFQPFELEGYEMEIKELEDAADQFLLDIDKSQKEYDVALAIHDKLLGELYNNSGDGYIENGISYQQTVYGTLVGRNGQKYSVCEGEADTYQYLLKKCGIKCTILFGGLGGGKTYEDAYSAACSYEGRHEWNIAFLDGKWYEIDVTHDKYNVNALDDSHRNAILASDTYLYSVTHRYWAKNTKEMSKSEMTDDMIFEYNGKRLTNVPAFGVHIRATDPNAYYYSQDGLSQKRFVRVMEVAPIAE